MTDTKVIKDIVEAMNQSNKGTSPYDTTATVVRIEDGTAWCHIPGGVDETPVAMSVNAKPGDTVRVRVSGGHAWMIGNDTAPPTDDTRANLAKTSADQAQTTADKALADAARASVAADQAEHSAAAAQTAAQAATEAAEDAEEQAAAATSAANSALTQLSTVEDVVGTLNWISEHGTYTASTDTEVIAGKYYFTRTGSGTTADPYVYTVVTNPSGDPSDLGYYELDSIDEAVSNYIATHLALTDNGLYVLSDNSGWKVLIASDGVYIIDENGNTKARYKDTIKIGGAGGSAIRISSQDIQMEDASGTSIFRAHLSNGEDGTAEIGSTFVVSADGWTGTVETLHTIYEVTGLRELDGPTLPEIPTKIGDYSVYISTPLPAGTYQVLYKTLETVFNFRLGTTWSADVGDGATMIGGENAALSQYSAAIGYGCLANYNAQVAVGRWNSIDFTGERAFVVGNGNGHYGRSDAMIVTWGGNIEMALDTSASSGTTDGDLYAAITDLGWESEVIV